MKLPPDSPFYAWEGEGWCDDMLVRTVPRIPVKVPHPAPESIWTSVQSRRRVRVRWALGGHVSVEFTDFATKVHRLDRFLVLYQPV